MLLIIPDACIFWNIFKSQKEFDFFLVRIQILKWDFLSVFDLKSRWGVWCCCWGWKPPASCWCPRCQALGPWTTAAGGGECSRCEGMHWFSLILQTPQFSREDPALLWSHGGLHIPWLRTLTHCHVTDPLKCFWDLLFSPPNVSTWPKRRNIFYCFKCIFTRIFPNIDLQRPNNDAFTFIYFCFYTVWHETSSLEFKLNFGSVLIIFYLFIFTRSCSVLI